VIGTSQTTIPDPASGSTESHAFLWEHGVMQDLGTLGGNFSFGGDINDRGRAGGVSLTAPDPQTGQSAQHVFVWDSGHLADLTLGGNFAEGPTFNNRGQAVGHSTLPGEFEDHAFLWVKSGLAAFRLQSVRTHPHCTPTTARITRRQYGTASSYHY
jgi:probable HAF family extracellular repeat protein